MGFLWQLGQKRRPRVEPVVWMDSTGGGTIQVGCNSGSITVLQLPARCHECPVLASHHELRRVRRVLTALLAVAIAAASYAVGAHSVRWDAEAAHPVKQMTAMSS